MRACQPVSNGHAKHDKIIIERPGGTGTGHRELPEWIEQWRSR